MAATRIQIGFKLSVSSVSAVGTALILGVGGVVALRGSITAGELLIFISYLAALYAPMETLAYSSAGYAAAVARARRVFEVLDATEVVAERPGAPALVRGGGAIALEGVRFGYAADRPVLRDVTLAVAPGEVVAVVGPTGAGKSTLVGLVPRFFDPWTGRVCVDGQDVRGVTLASVRAQVALVLQEPVLLPLTVAENIAYGRPGASAAEIEAAARAANAHEFITRLPEGYATVLAERGASLSGGQKQRLSIARALLKDAPILILDEPTSALDAETEGLLLDALGRLMKGRTTLIIAHRLTTIRTADRIVAMADGRVVEEGSHDALLARDGLYARLHQRQFTTALGGAA
jgi:ATP-binding cassette subfamily B protein/subfamily B ATP-binding cassette protein MsbA